MYRMGNVNAKKGLDAGVMISGLALYQASFSSKYKYGSLHKGVA
jgi:hypothetical protein